MVHEFNSIPVSSFVLHYYRNYQLYVGLPNLRKFHMVLYSQINTLIMIFVSKGQLSVQEWFDYLVIYLVTR